MKPESARRAGQRDAFRVRDGVYKASKRSLTDGANVLPHGVRVKMTTLPNGKARWTYTEIFRASQFPTYALARQTLNQTVAAFISPAPHGWKISIHDLSITITGEGSRGEFADSMTTEFLAWGGAIGKVTLARFVLGALRMLGAGLKV